MTVWIGVIGTILGTLVGGGLALLNTHLQFRHQVRRERQKLLLSKLEELHVVLSAFRKSYKTSTVDQVQKSLGADPSRRTEDEISVPIERLQLLVSFYTPELTALLQQIEKCRKEYETPLLKSVLSSKEGEATKKQNRNALFVEQKKLDKACADMQAEVVRLSKRYI